MRIVPIRSIAIAAVSFIWVVTPVSAQNAPAQSPPQDAKASSEAQVETQAKRASSPDGVGRRGVSCEFFGPCGKCDCPTEAPSAKTGEPASRINAGK